MPQSQISRSVVRSESARSRVLERCVKGFANHRRIEMLELLKKHPDLSLTEVASQLEIDTKTASEHLRRLALAGLVLKRNRSREVLHAITPRADNVLTFLRKLV